MTEENNMGNKVNYLDNTSTSQNYFSNSSSSPESFPDFMQNGILINYEYPIYSDEH